MSTEQLEKFQDEVEIPEGVTVTQKKHMLTFVGPLGKTCLLYTSPSPRDISGSRMPSSA